MRFETIKQILSDADQARIEIIAEESGVPLPTLMKIKYGQTENPRIRTIEALAAYLGTIRRSRRATA